MKTRIVAGALVLVAAATLTATTSTESAEAKWRECVEFAEGTDASLHACDRRFGEFDYNNPTK